VYMKMHCLGGRVLKPEILDTLPPEEARESLADLVRINKYWGGHSTLRKLVDDVIPPGEPFTLLDVGAASGDIGRCLCEWRPQAQVTSLDYLESHLKACAGPRVAGDAFALPFAPRSFDYVFSSQFLHHFTDDQVVELLAGFGRVARRQVLVIDLWRHPMPYYFISQTRWLFGWHPVSVHDGTISVEAAFRPRELVDLARRAGLAGPRARAFVPAFRIALCAGAL
jgi:2-polyprenyl-3-methyl-5-hydroxy-6-metoxy-1,4-benzoquinol methylase